MGMEIDLAGTRTGWLVTLSVHEPLVESFVHERWHYVTLEEALEQIRLIANYLATHTQQQLRVKLKDGISI